MFVVKSRITGLFFRNTTGAGSWCSDKTKRWTDDLQDVKPFRTIGSIKASLTPRKHQRGEHPCCKAVKWSSHKGYTNQCEHFKYQRECEDKRFEELYQILHVKLIETA